MVYSRWRKLAYSAGSLSAAVSYQAFSAYLFYFYVQVCALPIPLYSLGFAIYGIWNAINDPLFGYISDRTRTKWGRRIPYVVFGNIPLMLSFMLVWAPYVEHINSTLLSFSLFGSEVELFGLPLDLFLYFVIIGSLFDTFYTMVILAWTALFPEMFTDLKERTEVNAYRQLFSVVGLILGLALPLTLVKLLGSWWMMGVLLGLVTGAGVFLSLLGSKETKAFAMEEPLGVIEAFRFTLKNRSFMTFVLANLTIQYIFLIEVQQIPIFMAFAVGAGEYETSLFLLLVFIMVIVGLPIWKKIIDTKGPRFATMVSFATFGLVLSPLLIISDYTTLLMFSPILGIALCGPMIVVDILISDVIDEDEVKTGKRREGMYFGANALIMRLATVLVAASVLILPLFGYIEGATTQTASAIFGIKLLITIFPILAALVGILIMKYYPLYGEYLDTVKEKIKQMHKEKLKMATS